MERRTIGIRAVGKRIPTVAAVAMFVIVVALACLAVYLLFVPSGTDVQETCAQICVKAGHTSGICMPSAACAGGVDLGQGGCIIDTPITEPQICCCSES